MKRFNKPMRIMGRFFLIVVVLPLYKLYLTTKRLATRFYAPRLSRHWIIHTFSRRYLIHVVIILLASFTIAANLNAYETRQETTDQKSIAAELFAPEDLGRIEAEGPITETKRITRYLGSTGVEIQPAVTTDPELLTPTTIGGSAVVSRILSPVEEGLRQRDEVVYYTVQPGDTISEIAERFGVSANTILWENNLSAYRIIRPGDTLSILPTSGIRHKVASGETLNSIARKYGVEASAIIKTNKLAAADDIQIGEQLLIPGGSQPVVAQPTYSLRAVTPAPSVRPVTKVVTESGMTWPNSCRRISQYYGWRHSGIDIACPYGSTIYAADSGTVISAEGGWNGGYGIMIVIDHGNGLQTLYGHLSKLFVKIGEEVTKGQAIAAEGSTGKSTGPHVHFEVRSGGVRQNPFSYVQ